MKKYVLIALLSLSIFGCEKVDKLLTFTFEQQTSVTIPAVAAIPVSPIDIPIPSITTNSSSTFENNNTSADYVKDVKLTKMTMKITAPEGKKFSFLDEIHIFISTNSENKIELAWKTDIPDDVDEIELDVTDKNLDTYIKSDQFDLDVKVTIGEILLHDVDMDMNMTFKVTANLLKD